MFYAAALELISFYEGFHAKPYVCPGNKVTIGYGTTVYPSGRKVRLDDPPITKAQALNYLRSDLVKVGDRLYGRYPHVQSWRPHRQAAMVSKIYNVGMTGAAKTQFFQQVDLAYADWRPPASLLANSVITANGLVVKGLQRRRYAEALVYKGVPPFEAVKQAELKFP